MLQRVCEGAVAAFVFDFKVALDPVLVRLLRAKYVELKAGGLARFKLKAIVTPTCRPWKYTWGSNLQI